MSEQQQQQVRQVLVQHEKDPSVYIFWCPGCRHPHVFYTSKGWTFNGSFERPSFSPSLLNTDPESNYRCHLTIVDGIINYYQDCSHEYAGKSVIMYEVNDTGWIGK